MIKIVSETQVARVHLNKGCGMVGAFVGGPQHFLRNINACVLRSSVDQRNREPT